MFVAQSFAFSGGERMDVRLAYRTLGTLAKDLSNAALLLHGTTGSGRQFLQPAFAGAMFGSGSLLDARSHFVILPDAFGHGGSSKPSDGLEHSFPRYGYADMVAAQHRPVTEGLGLQRLAVRAEFACQAAGQADHAGLRRDIVSLARNAGVAGRRADVNDPAPAAPGHQRQHRLTHQRRAGQVDVDDLAPVGRGYF